MNDRAHLVNSTAGKLFERARVVTKRAITHKIGPYFWEMAQPSIHILEWHMTMMKMA